MVHRIYEWAPNPLATSDPNAGRVSVRVGVERVSGGISLGASCIQNLCV